MVRSHCVSNWANGNAFENKNNISPEAQESALCPRVSRRCLNSLILIRWFLRSCSDALAGFSDTIDARLFSARLFSPQGVRMRNARFRCKTYSENVVLLCARYALACVALKHSTKRRVVCHIHIFPFHDSMCTMHNAGNRCCSPLGCQIFIPAALATWRIYCILAFMLNVWMSFYIYIYIYVCHMCYAAPHPYILCICTPIYMPTKPTYFKIFYVPRPEMRSLW